MTKPKSQTTGAEPKTFYSDQFTPDELALVAAFVAEPSLDDEIWMQRVLNHRLFRYMDDTASDKPIELAMLVKVAEALGTGTGRVARLLRDRKALSGHTADIVKDVVARVLDELSAELGTLL